MPPKTILYLFICLLFTTITCKEAPVHQPIKHLKDSNTYLLTRWDTLPISYHFTGKILAGDVHHAYYCPIGTVTLGAKTFTLDTVQNAGFADLLLQDTILRVPSMALDSTISELNTEKAPRRILFPKTGFDAITTFSTTKKLGILWNVLPLRYFLRSNTDTLSSIKIEPIDLDKDPEQECIIHFHTVKSLELQIVLDKEKDDWVIKTETSSFSSSFIEKSTGRDIYFDKNINCYIKESRFDDDQFSLSNDLFYYYNGNWSEPLSIADKEAVATLKVGNYYFVTETNKTYSWKDATTFVVTGEERTTGGWLKKPFIKPLKEVYHWHEAENEFVTDDKNQRENTAKGANYWDNMPKLPIQTVIGEYTFNYEEAHNIKAVLQEKIIGDGYLKTEVVGGYYFFNNKKWEFEPSGDLITFETTNQSGEGYSLEVHNTALIAEINRTVYQNDREESGELSSQKIKFPKTWLDTLSKRIIPKALKNSPILAYTNSGFDIENLRSSETKVKAIPISGAQIQAFFLENKIKKQACLVVIDVTKGQILNIMTNTPEQRIRMEGNLLYANFDIAWPNAHGNQLTFKKWGDTGWYDVLSLNEKVEEGRDILEEVRIETKLLDQTITATYFYSIATKDRKTVLFAAQPVKKLWKYNSYSGQYYLSGVPENETMTWKQNAASELFKQNCKKLANLLENGNEEQKKWLNLYFPFYCDKYNMSNFCKIPRIKQQSYSERINSSEEIGVQR